MRTPDRSTRTSGRLQSARFAPSGHATPVADVQPAYDPTLPSSEVRRIIGFAVLCGALGEFVLRDAPGIGIGMSVYLLLVAAAIVSIAYRRSGGLPGSVRLPLFGALPFALLLAVRDNEMLTTWNLAFAIGALVLAADAVSPASMLQLTNARLRDVFRRFTRSVRHMIRGAVPLVRQDALAAMRGYSRRWYAARLIARAAILALVVASAFGALLAAGDPVFRSVFAWTVQWSPQALLFHLLGICCWAWPVAGFLRGALRNPPAARPTTLRLPATLGVVDAATALGAVNVIFALFVLVQMRVFFGGQAYVVATTGLTVAEYARSGFFVLVSAAALIVFFLLGINALLGDDGMAERPSVRRQACVLIGLTGVVLVSAVYRMALYVSSFGLSLDRVYALAAIFWIGALLVLFGLTVLRQRSHRFALGVILSGWITLLGVNAANPDALVVADSARRLARHETVDWRYLSQNLSADSVPLLVELLLRPPQAAPWQASVDEGLERYHAARRLLMIWGRGSQSLGGAWSRADAGAQHAVRANGSELQQFPAP